MGRDWPIEGRHSSVSYNGKFGRSGSNGTNVIAEILQKTLWTVVFMTFEAVSDVV